MSFQPFATFSQKVILAYTDFATAGLTNTVPIFTPVGNQFIVNTVMIITQAFSGGSIATYTIETDVDSTAIIGATNALTPTFPGISGVSGASPAFITNVQGTTHVLQAKAISTVGNLNTATQGSVTFDLVIGQLPD